MPRRPAPLLVALLALAGCADEAGLPPAPPPPALRIEPAAAILRTGETFDFAVVGEGLTDLDVTWRLTRAPAAGAVAPDGRYAAPGWAGVFSLVATDRRDTTLTAVARVEVRETYEPRVAALETYVLRTWTPVQLPLAVAQASVKSLGLALAADGLWFAAGDAAFAGKLAADGVFAGWYGRGLLSIAPQLDGVTGWHGAESAELPCPGREAGQFETVNDVAADSRGRLYVASDDRVTVIGPDGLCLGTLTRPGGLAFGIAWDVAVAPGDFVYVFDAADSRITLFDAEGGGLMSFGGANRFSPGTALAADADGELFLVDAQRHRVQHLDGWGTLLGEWGSRGTSLVQLEAPCGVAVDRQGFVYVADTGNGRVVKTTSDGAVMGAWQMAGPYAALARSPWGIGVGADGVVWVTDGSPETRRGNVLSYRRTSP